LLERATETKLAEMQREEREQRVLVNFVFARFLCSPLVGTAGTQWMLFADQHGAASPECRALDHLYRQGLDASPPDLPSFTEQGISVELSRVPTTLLLRDYPMHMETKYKERKAKAAAVGKEVSVRLVRSTASLLAKLYDALLPDAAANRAPPVYLDKDLCTSTWKREPNAQAGRPEYDNRYLNEWEDKYREYSRRVGELRNSRPKGPLDDDDPFWTQWRELVDEYRKGLLERHSDWRVFQVELYAEVAAIYETCYRGVKRQQQLLQQQLLQQQLLQQQRRGSDGASSSAGPSLSSSLSLATAASATGSEQSDVSLARLKFVWRVAGDHLRDMKWKAAK